MLRPSTLISLLALAGAAPAQTKVFAWPSQPSGGPFQRTIVGDFTGDHRMSAFVLRQGVLHFVYEPATHVAVSAVPLQWLLTDVVRIASHATSPRQRFLATTGGGAVLGRLDPDGTYTIHPVLDAAWARARGLVERRRAGSPTYVVAGIGVDGNSLRTAAGVLGADPVALAVIYVGAPVESIALLDWDHDGELEVVALAQGLAFPFELGGTPLAPVHTGATGTVAAVLPDEPSGDRLALAGQIGGVARLRVLDQNGGDPPVDIDRGLLVVDTVVPTGLAAHDLAGDGDTDLLLTHAGSPRAPVFENRVVPHPTLPFTAGQPQILVVPDVAATPGVPNPCPGVWTDLDHDGIVDLWQLLDGGVQAALTFHADGSLAVKNLVDWVAETTHDTDTGHLRVAIPFGPAVGYTHVDVVMWRQSNPLAVAPPLDLVSPYHASLAIANLEVEGGRYILPIPCAAPFWPDHEHYYLEVRFLHASTGAVSPTLLAGFTMKARADELESFFMSYLDEDADDGLPKKKIVNTRAEHVGGIITRKDLPPFGTGAPPQTDV